MSGCTYVSSNSSWAEKVCGWDDRHPGLTAWNLLNNTRIENGREVRILYVILYVQLVLGGQNSVCCVRHYEQSAWTAICQLMTKLEMMHNCKHRCAALLAYTQGCHIKKHNRKQVMHRNEASWNRTVLKFRSKHQLDVHNCLLILVCDIHVIAQSEKSHCTISLIGCAPHT